MNIQHNGYAQDSMALDEPTLRKFYTKKGWLTNYALSCGYIEKVEKGTVRTTLWMEHGTIHVRQFDDTKGEKHVCWFSYSSVTAARESFKVLAS